MTKIIDALPDIHDTNETPRVNFGDFIPFSKEVFLNLPEENIFGIQTMQIITIPEDQNFLKYARSKGFGSKEILEKFQGIYADSNVIVRILNTNSDLYNCGYSTKLVSMYKNHKEIINFRGQDIGTIQPIKDENGTPIGITILPYK